MNGIVSYGTYLPRPRLRRDAIAAALGTASALAETPEAAAAQAPGTGNEYGLDHPAAAGAALAAATGGKATDMGAARTDTAAAGRDHRPHAGADADAGETAGPVARGSRAPASGSTVDAA